MPLMAGTVSSAQGIIRAATRLIGVSHDRGGTITCLLHFGLRHCTN